MPIKTPAKKSASSNTFTAEERAAMRERSKESKSGDADPEAELLAKLAAMPEPDRALGERLHALVKSAAPTLQPKLWYGMPAYANSTGQVVCFYQNAQKFKTRYATLGFSDKAKLDDGQMWPVAFALRDLTPAEEARIVALLSKAVS